VGRDGEEGKMEVEVRDQRPGYVLLVVGWDARWRSRSAGVMWSGSILVGAGAGAGGEGGEGSMRYWIVRSYWPEEGRGWSVVLRFGARVGRSIPI
jgi:hypothetical protein